MAYLQSHQTLATHPKTRKMARRLDASIPAVIGHLHLLWYWALDHAIDGDVSRFDPDDLADAAGWEGDPDTFVKALTDCGSGGAAGFLDPDGHLHDWADYGGKYGKRVEAARKAANARWESEGDADASDAQCDGNANASDGHALGNAEERRGEESTNPSLLPEGDQPSRKSWRDAYPPPSKLERNAYPHPFEDVWTAYPPNNGAKKAAYRTWRATVLRDGEDVIPKLLTAASHYRQLVEAERRERGKIKHAETFFGPDEHWRTHVEKPAQTTVEPDRRSKGAYL